jgi:hypothetical protein
MLASELCEGIAHLVRTSAERRRQAVGLYSKAKSVRRTDNAKGLTLPAPFGRGQRGDLACENIAKAPTGRGKGDKLHEQSVGALQRLLTRQNGL